MINIFKTLLVAICFSLWGCESASRQVIANQHGSTANARIQKPSEGAEVALFFLSPAVVLTAGLFYLAYQYENN